MENGNFILRKPMPYVRRLPTKEWQEATTKVDDPMNSWIQEPATATKIEKEANHKTVIYFGDSAERVKCNKKSDFESNVDEKIDDNRQVVMNNDDDDDHRVMIDNEPPQEEIVVNVTPNREDVMRIEEDETRVEDYWSLPGDRSGFKADWSFVQQWRLRG